MYTTVSLSPETKERIKKIMGVKSFEDAIKELLEEHEKLHGKN
jgi:predicted CopG family antitoxin